MTDHTPAPWRNACFQVYGGDGSRVAHTGMGQLPPHRSHEAEANAATIVRAVNSHDPLVSAVNALLSDYRTEGCPDPDCHVCKASKAAKELALNALKTAGAS